MNRKRRGDAELTADNCLNSDGDDDFATTPQLASPEEMAKRRIVRVRRPNQPGSATSGLFKNLGATPVAATSTSSTPFSFGGIAATATAASSSAAGATTASTTTFGGGGFTAFGSFGSNTSSNTTATANQTTGSITTAAPNKPSFFSGFSMTPNAPATGTSSAGAAKPVFPTGAFNFSNAVNSFVEARKKAEETAQQQQGDNDGEDELDEDGNGGSGPLLKSQSMIQAAPGEVLVVAPSKLFGFDKTSKSWVERGEGDAKLKKESVQKKEAEKKNDESNNSSSSNGVEKISVYRLLVRDGYSLNAVMSKTGFLLTTAANKHIIFTAGTAEGPAHYLLKFTGPQAEENAKKFTEKLKDVLKEVSGE